MHVTTFKRPNQQGLWAVALGLVCALMCGCGKGDTATGALGPAAGTSKTIPVTVAAAREKELQRSVHVVGNLVAMEKATLGNRVTGNVTHIYVEHGDKVKPGAKLAEIDPERYEMAVEEATQSLQETLARLGLKEIPGEEFDVDQTAPVKKALSEQEAQKIKFDRTESLYKQHNVTDFEFFDQKAAYQVAQDAVQAARDDAHATLASARQRRKMIEMMRKDLNDATISAPDGTTPDGKKIESYTVAERRISSGEYVREGTAMFTLVSDGELKLQARVPEKYLGQIKIGQLVQFDIEAYPDEAFSGKITALDPIVDESNRMFLFEARVENADGKLKPGSFVQGEVLTSSQKVVMVPVDAITSFAGVTKIYALDPNKRVRAITVQMGQQETEKQGEMQRTWVEVMPATGTAGQDFLHGGDQVATSGLSKLTDGAAVDVQSDAATRTALN